MSCQYPNMLSPHFQDKHSDKNRAKWNGNEPAFFYFLLGKKVLFLELRVIRWEKGTNSKKHVLCAGGQQLQQPTTAFQAPPCLYLLPLPVVSPIHHWCCPSPKIPPNLIRGAPPQCEKCIFLCVACRQTTSQWVWQEVLQLHPSSLGGGNGAELHPFPIHRHISWISEQAVLLCLEKKGCLAMAGPVLPPQKCLKADRNHCANGKEDSAEGSALPDTKFGGALHIPIELRSICFSSLYLHLPLLILSTFKYFTTYLRLA